MYPAWVHHLSMPSPTPPEKVLAAARKFARENFAQQHRYALVLLTDQQHPHVHMVVKAESEEGGRLQIDKALLRLWREDFAQLMREQGIAANATPRVIRGRTRGKGPTQSTERISPPLLQAPGPCPIRARLLDTRRALLNAWFNVADALDVQGDHVLASDVRHFARHLSPVLAPK